MKGFNVGDKVEVVKYEPYAGGDIYIGMKGVVSSFIGNEFVCVDFPNPEGIVHGAWPMKPAELKKV